MSIATRTGDDGTTGLMYSRRVAKGHPRIEALGCLDELNAALGLARASSTEGLIRERLLSVQHDLVVLMGELATLAGDLPRYEKDGFERFTSARTAPLDQAIRELEAQDITYKGWATPGATLDSAALDLARATCRRAERRVCVLQSDQQIQNPEITVYLNRLSDLLWLLARWVETHQAGQPSGGREK